MNLSSSISSAKSGACHKKSSPWKLLELSSSTLVLSSSILMIFALLSSGLFGISTSTFLLLNCPYFGFSIIVFLSNKIRPMLIVTSSTFDFTLPKLVPGSWEPTLVLLVTCDNCETVGDNDVDGQVYVAHGMQLDVYKPCMATFLLYFHCLDNLHQIQSLDNSNHNGCGMWSHSDRKAL